MKKNFFAVAASTVIALSTMFVTSCSGPLAAGEDLEQIGIKAEKSVVDVENFSDIEAEKVSNITFRTSDGNVLKATVIGVTPETVTLTAGAENENSRTINVKLIGRNSDGVQRIAYTSYEQRKAAGNDEPVLPTDPTVIDIRLEADTTMLYMAGTVNSNRAMMIINPVHRITTYSDGNVTDEEISQIDNLDVYIAGDKAHTDWISNSSDPMACVFWNGTTTEQVEESVYDVRGLEISEKKEYIRLNISAISDANAECNVAPQVVVITRDVKFTDPETGLSLEWKISGGLEFTSRTSIDEQRSALEEPEGSYRYVGTHKVELANICNGYAFATTVATTAIYNK